MRERVNFKHGFILTLLVFLFFFGAALVSPAKAFEEPPVIINEIAWMGTSVSTNDEWIELKNTTSEEIDLTGWHLLWGSVDIALTGLISGDGYYLLERTDDDSVPGVVADQLYVGSLSNTGADMVLVNELETVIDSAVFTVWPAGDNTTKQTMERVCPVDDGNLDSSWQNSELSHGTPRAVNFGCEALVCELVEINRVCQSDGVAEVEYHYTNQACGENLKQVEIDNSCACVYTDWQDVGCVADGVMQQAREQISSFAYCQAELTREVANLSCIAENDFLWQVHGRGCLLVDHQYQCGPSTASFGEDDSLQMEFILSDGLKQVDYLMTKINDQAPVAVYKSEEQLLHLVWQKMHHLIMVMGKGVWFQGKVD